MSKEKQISEMGCGDCLHFTACLLNSEYAPRPCSAYENKTDFRKQKEGEWIFRNDGAYGRTRCYCSACGKHSGIGGIRENQLKPFCPNCGAKMKGEQ